ncbi:MAG: c-type cytochrome biogenesis protein CcsB [Actinobacteria bacterium]|nr:c-type cytochrome biogenesis protein CcsB [Actinomycetota bacterium]
MANLESIFLMASLAGVVVSILFAVFSSVSSRRSSARFSTAEKSGSQTASELPKSGLLITTKVLIALSLLFVTLTLVFRVIQTGHGPFSNMYEFALSYVWGIIVMVVIFEWRYKAAAVRNVGLIVTLLLLIFATVKNARPQPLVPALQQSTLLSIHVASAVLAYGIFTISFGAAVLLLIQNRRSMVWLPDKEILDVISYRSVVIGFPLLTLTIVLGAVWADIAWGRFWSWDPKETSSLVTWLIYAVYIHARLMRGWKGIKAAIVLVAGFVAILLTFFGNYIFTGLHAYR